MFQIRKYALRALVALILTLSGCRYRDIELEQKPVDIYFRIDWSAFPGKELPTGVSIYCYPKNGKRPYVYKSNDIDFIQADMPPGIYDILVFNQVEAEFETITFSGMNSFSTAKVTLNKREKPKWITVDDEPVSCEPEWLAIDRRTNFEITEEMFYGENTHYIELKPQSVIFSATAIFRVARVEKILKTYGDFSGMACGMMLGDGKRLTTKTSHLFDSVHVYTYEEMPEVGEVAASFKCFGLPGSDMCPNSRVKKDNMLHFRFFLVDRSTYSDFTFKIGDRVNVSDSTLVISVEVGHGSDIPQDPSYDSDPDQPGILPDVHSSPESGFDVVIGKWKEEVIIDL